MPARSRILFLSGSCLTPYENIPESGILCENTKIIATGGASAFVRENELRVVELENTYAVPGFIDSHVHGAGGFDASRADSSDNEQMNKMSLFLARHGVTTFFPTMVTAPREKMLHTVSCLADMIEQEHDGADPAGIHIEGPFLNPGKTTGEQSKHTLAFDPVFLQELIDAGKNHVKIMTFAPEIDGAGQLIQMLLENGIIPSMGHSNAGEKDVSAAIEAGALRCTHLFNGMPPLHQRLNNLTLMALTDDRVAAELIIDGKHISPLMVNLASRMKPQDKLIGISNGMELSPSDTALTSADGVIRRNGVIEGSATTLETAWLHLKKYSPLPDTLAAACFSSTPAHDLGLISRGELKPGKKADITFFDEETNTVRMTVVCGKIVYDSQKNIN